MVIKVYGAETKRRFKDLEELEHFKDTSMFCVCGKLMTGLHMQGCRKLAKIEQKLRIEQKMRNAP